MEWFAFGIPFSVFPRSRLTQHLSLWDGEPEQEVLVRQVPECKAHERLRNLEENSHMASGPSPPDSLGFVDGSLELLLQLPHAAHGRVVPGCRLLVHQLAPCLGVLCLHDLQTTEEVNPAKPGTVPCWGIMSFFFLNTL